MFLLDKFYIQWLSSGKGWHCVFLHSFYFSPSIFDILGPHISHPCNSTGVLNGINTEVIKPQSRIWFGLGMLPSIHLVISSLCMLSNSTFHWTLALGFIVLDDFQGFIIESWFETGWISSLETITPPWSCLCWLSYPCPCKSSPKMLDVPVGCVIV